MSWFDLAALLASQLVAAGAIYGGIRADIANLHRNVADAKLAADKAHERIDSILERRNA